jgi:hypothetical protein
MYRTVCASVMYGCVHLSLPLNAERMAVLTRASKGPFLRPFVRSFVAASCIPFHPALMAPSLFQAGGLKKHLPRAIGCGPRWTASG